MGRRGHTKLQRPGWKKKKPYDKEGMGAIQRHKVILIKGKKQKGFIGM